MNPDIASSSITQWMFPDCRSFCAAGVSNLAPTAGSAKISDSKTKISGVEENLKVLTSKTKAAWERIGGWFITHQEPGGCDCLRRSSNQPALYLPNPEIGCARDHCIDEQTRPPNTRCRTHRSLQHARWAITDHLARWFNRTIMVTALDPKIPVDMNSK